MGAGSTRGEAEVGTTGEGWGAVRKGDKTRKGCGVETTRDASPGRWFEVVGDLERWVMQGGGRGCLEEGLLASRL